jgi:hypothetical protein
MWSDALSLPRRVTERPNRILETRDPSQQGQCLDKRGALSFEGIGRSGSQWRRLQGFFGRLYEMHKKFVLLDPRVKGKIPSRWDWGPWVRHAHAENVFPKDQGRSESIVDFDLNRSTFGDPTTLPLPCQRSDMGVAWRQAFVDLH